MLCVLAAMAAVFAHHQFFRRIDFIAFRDVVLAFAHGADHRQ